MTGVVDRDSTVKPAGPVTVPTEFFKFFIYTNIIQDYSVYICTYLAA